MPNSFFKFKQFTIHQDRSGMKVTTDSCLFGAWVASKISNSQVTSMVDLGTGTGLLSLMCAQKNKNLNIDAFEMEENAIVQANENFQISPWSDRLKIIHADIRNFAFDKAYDLLVSNPPFYENELKSEPGKRRLAHHEGLQLSELFAITRDLLSQNGEFFFLLPYKRRMEIERLLQKERLAAREIVHVRQTKSHEPIRILLHGSRSGEEKSSPSTSSEIVIKDGDNYSAEFTSVLKDYYLYL